VKPTILYVWRDADRAAHVVVEDRRADRVVRVDESRSTEMAEARRAVQAWEAALPTEPVDRVLELLRQALAERDRASARVVDKMREIVTAPDPEQSYRHGDLLWVQRYEDQADRRFSDLLDAVHLVLPEASHRWRNRRR